MEKCTENCSYFVFLATKSAAFAVDGIRVPFKIGIMLETVHAQLSTKWLFSSMTSHMFFQIIFRDIYKCFAQMAFISEASIFVFVSSFLAFR